MSVNISVSNKNKTCNDILQKLIKHRNSSKFKY